MMYVWMEREKTKVRPRVLHIKMYNAMQNGLRA